MRRPYYEVIVNQLVLDVAVARHRKQRDDDKLDKSNRDDGIEVV